MLDTLLYVDSHYASPYAMSAFVALREKGVAFSIRTLDLAMLQNRVPKFARLSITQRVPTLVHDDLSLSESSAIAEYADEAFEGPPLYPAAPKHRARARQVQAWLRSDLAALKQERSTEVIFRAPIDTPLSAAGQAAVDRLLSAAGQWLENSDGHLFSTWCIADLDLALMLQRLVHNGDPVPGHLKNYATRQWQRASVQEWVNQDRPAR